VDGFVLRYRKSLSEAGRPTGRDEIRCEVMCDSLMTYYQVVCVIEAAAAAAAAAVDCHVHLRHRHFALRTIFDINCPSAVFTDRATSVRQFADVAVVGNDP